jgi:4-cresol dehydrogenase (hydroxylating)
LKRKTPPGLTESQLDAALRAFAGVVGAEWVLATDEDRDSYLDAYGFSQLDAHIPSAAVAPQSVEEVQALLRLANEHKVPLWPIARGKNLGYGGSAPVLNGTVVLDLGRMNRILEVDEKYGYCVVEPGVGFYDIFAHFQEQRIPYWLSIPANAWGSVVGNALDRGIGYTPYGDHTTRICGMEVVLPQGEVVRTGMGAQAGNQCWQHYPYGFGPAWDQLFVQSNFGVVTKMGLWLMPEPEATLIANVQLPRREDIRWAIDALAKLRLHNVLENNMVFGSYLHDAAVLSQRDEWYRGKGAIPDEVSERIIQHYKLGWWKFRLTLFGHEPVIRAKEQIVRAAIEPDLGKPLDFKLWRRGDPIENSGAGVPGTLPLQIVNWRGGRGGHVGFSPVMPPDGQLALDAFRRNKARYEEFGLDYYTSFTVGPRHINNVNLIIYDRDDVAMTGSVRNLLETLVADAQRLGYSEYRSHLMFMDHIAQTYDFNQGSLWRLNETLKDAVDPNGILAPGKSGIWPAAYRQEKP